jgi:4-amino-4-deoxy-L-arabinose transferase-like glycosyltransferase
MGLGHGDTALLAAVEDPAVSTDIPTTRLSLWWPISLGAVLLLALVLRVWNIAHGLPAVYNPDEAGHFVRYAIQFFETGSLQLDYFVNPPALTNLFAGAFGAVFGGATGAVRAFAENPGSVYLVARLVVAVLGVASVWILYLVGKALFDRRVALLSAAVAAVAFLPVHWSHYATNDVALLVPATLSLLGTARVLRSGGLGWYSLAGAGLGLAIATKYTAGIVLLPLVAAFAVDLRRDRSRALKGVGLAAVLSLAAFFLATPSALVNPAGFLDGIDRLTLYPEGNVKVGQTEENGWRYYLWVLTWGLGWVPLAFGVVGAVHVVARRRTLAWVLLPAPVLYLLFMGNQDRFFGRWLLPIFPFVILLAACGAFVAVDRLATRWPRWRQAVSVAAVGALLIPSLLHSVHANLVRGRTDTRQLTWQWMLENLATEGRIVTEVLPTPLPLRAVSRRSDSLTRVVRAWSGLSQDDSLPSDNIAKFLEPSLIDFYRRRGICWVVTGSLRYERALVEPDETPGAVAYYERLADESEVAYRVSPYLRGRGPVPFNFDWATNFYPFDYHLPGGEMIVYHLNACD